MLLGTVISLIDELCNELTIYRYITDKYVYEYTMNMSMSMHIKMRIWVEQVYKYEYK